MKKKLCALFFAVLLLLTMAIPTFALATEAPAKQINWVSMIGFSLIIGLVVAGIVILVMKSGMKSVYRQSGASNYAKEGRVKLIAQHDQFLYRQVTKTPRPKPQEQQQPTRPQ